MRYVLLLLLVGSGLPGLSQELSGLILKYKMENTCEVTDEVAESPANGVMIDVEPATNKNNTPNTAFAFNLSGNSSYITLGTVEKLKLPDDKSISFYVKPVITGSARTGSIFTYGNAIVIGYVEETSIPKLDIKFGGTSYMKVNLKNNEWQTVTVTFIKNYSSTKSKAYVYLDGIQAAESEQNKSTQDFTNTIALIGPVSQTSLTNGFKGTLDDLRIYNRTLSSTEVLNAVLPVKLASFAAVKKKNIVTLSWKTSEEDNFSHFNVQRSYDGIQFENVARIQGGKYNYLVYDNDISQLNVWYRLQMVDRDGKTEFSNIIKAENDTNTAPPIQIFPNPGNEVINFRGLPANRTVNIISATGSVVRNKLTANKINIADLRPGVYYIAIYDDKGNKKMISKFIKTKDR